MPPGFYKRGDIDTSLFIQYFLSTSQFSVLQHYRILSLRTHRFLDFKNITFSKLIDLVAKILCFNILFIWPSHQSNRSFWFCNFVQIARCYHRCSVNWKKIKLALVAYLHWGVMVNIISAINSTKLGWILNVRLRSPNFILEETRMTEWNQF